MDFPNLKQFSQHLLLMLLAIIICAQPALAQAQLQPVSSSSGGTIVYGIATGANSQPEGLIAMLRMVHKSCGEKPQIVQVFNVRGTDSLGLFFKVVNHPAGNRQVAGLILSAMASQQVQVAMVSNSADRFNSAMNPMLRQLFAVWQPSGLAAATSTSSDRNSSPQPTPSNASSSAAAKLHKVTASDNSASVSIPDGWIVKPSSARGSIMVSGPNGELVGINMSRLAIDPTSPGQRQQRFRVNVPGVMTCSFKGDLTKTFPDMYQAWRQAAAQPASQLQVDQITPLPAGQGQHCVHVQGRLNISGTGMQALDDMMCAMDPSAYGNYTVSLNQSLIPIAFAAQEHHTVMAIFASFQLNKQVINQQMAEANQQAAANNQRIIAGAQQAVQNIDQIGAQATARYNATQIANDAQHAGWWAQQDNNARTAQGFTNYQRDQTVVRDVQQPDLHATVSNSTAAWLEQSFPYRVEEVPIPQYIKGTDF